MENKIVTSEDRAAERQEEMAVLCSQIQVLVERLAVLTTEDSVETVGMRPSSVSDQDG